MEQGIKQCKTDFDYGYEEGFKDGKNQKKIGVVEIKQLTIDELREQFESNHNFLNLEKRHNAKYDYLDIESNHRWDAYVCCAELNNILKE